MNKSPFMEKALEIAFSKIGSTSPNPSVGAVIVKDQKVVARGGTCEAGSDHAEVVALKKARDIFGGQKGPVLKGAEIFVSLEPCSHFGKTPPCADAIIESGIRVVHMPILDPNPLVAGKGVQKLIASGVKVEMMHQYADAAADLIRPFKKLILRHKPYIVHKCAATMDGRIATPSGDSRWISSPFSRLLAHKLRQKVDAVIVGKNTCLMDDPALTVRLDDFDPSIHQRLHDDGAKTLGRDNYFFRRLMENEDPNADQPLRVLVGLPEEIDLEKKFFSDGNYLIFEKEEKVKALFEKDASLEKKLKKDKLCILSSTDGREFIHDLLEALADYGIMYAMLEGGSLLAGSFFDAGEIDQFLYVTAPKIIGSGKSPVEGEKKEFMKEALLLNDITMVMAGPDMVTNGYREKYNFEMM